MKPKAERIFYAVVGLLIAATCTVLFVLHLDERWRVDADLVVFLFFAGGALAGIGFFFVYRLAPRRVQSSLFTDSNGVFLQPAVPDAIRSKAVDPPAEDVEDMVNAAAMPLVKPAELNSISNGRTTILRYRMHEGLGAVGLVIVLIFASALPVRLPIGWGFLWLGIAGGGVVALVLGRWNQTSKVSGYAIPVAGGVVGVIVICGMGFVMTHFHYLRVFLGMAVAGGIAVALFLRWGRLREGPSRPLI